jgi:hypothetical protein
MRIIVERTIDKLFEMCDSKYYEDNLTSHSSVTQLYQCIWTNVSKRSKIHYWCQIKKRSFDDGPPRPIQTLNITKVENTIIIPAGEPGKNGTVTSFCPFNIELTGGAYRKDPNAVIVNSAATANNSGWTVSGVNSFPFAVLVY